MSGAKKKVETGLSDAFNNVNKGLDATRRGNWGELAQSAEGMLYDTTTGLGNFGQMNVLGFKNSSKDQRLEGEQAGIDARDAQDLIDQTNNAKKAKVTSMLNEAVKMRQRTPGKAQTLLTSAAAGPGAGNPDTLLTVAGRK